MLVLSESDINLLWIFPALTCHQLQKQLGVILYMMLLWPRVYVLTKKNMVALNLLLKWSWLLVLAVSCAILNPFIFVHIVNIIPQLPSLDLQASRTFASCLTKNWCVHIFCVLLPGSILVGEEFWVNIASLFLFLKTLLANFKLLMFHIF